MRCVPVDTEVCASNLALWGGVTYVMPGREATLLVEAAPATAGREVTADRRAAPAHARARSRCCCSPRSPASLVVLGAAYLVWIRPGPMTWGFFAYTIQFNPGQAFLFYAWLQQWPRALLAQDVASCVLQAAGYTGLLLFALRAPVDRAEGVWRRIERALPALAILFLVVSLTSLGSAFGYPTEFAMRASILLGFAVSAAALAILIGRRGDLSPRDYQRLRWVIWGCAHRAAGLSPRRGVDGDLAAGEPLRRRRGDGGHRWPRLPRSTASCACSWSRRCVARRWSTSGSRCAAQRCSASYSACPPISCTRS